MTRKTTLHKKRVVKKSVSKKRITKKSVSKKRVVKKSVSKKRITKKSVSKKRVVKKSVSKKRITKKSVGKKGMNKSFATAMSKLIKLPPSQRSQAMKVANDKFIRHLCQKVNGLRRKRLDPQLQKRIHSQSKNLRKLASKKVSIGVKRKILSQRGGFLLSLIGPLVASVGGMILKSVLGKK